MTVNFALSESDEDRLGVMELHFDAPVRLTALENHLKARKESFWLLTSRI